ncbi:hypothetical protein D3C80_1651820 [compost metagenome]
MNPIEYDVGLARMVDYHSKTKDVFTKIIKDNVEEPLGPLCGKVNKVFPHIPYYLAEGNVVQNKWKETFVDRVGNKATLTKVEVLKKKGKIVDYVIQVTWED